MGTKNTARGWKDAAILLASGIAFALAAEKMGYLHSRTVLEWFVNVLGGCMYNGFVALVASFPALGSSPRFVAHNNPEKGGPPETAANFHMMAGILTLGVAEAILFLAVGRPS